MDVIRTFVAVPISEDLRESIFKVQQAVAKLAPDVKWIPPQNYHVTLKFLGDVVAEDMPMIFSAVEEAVRPFPPFEMSISGLGAFPNARNARVVWVGLEMGRTQLIEMARAVDKALEPLGFERETKPFKAHITIGRVKYMKHPDKLVKGINETDAADMGTQTIGKVVVMQSELLREGSIYSPIATFEL